MNYGVALDFKEGKLVGRVEFLELLHLAFKHALEEGLNGEKLFHSDQVSILQISGGHLFNHIAFLFPLLLFLL